MFTKWSALEKILVSCIAVIVVVDSMFFIIVRGGTNMSNAKSVSPYALGKWFLGDPHVHGYGCGGKRTMNQLIEPLKQGNINVASVLLWGQSESFEKKSFAPSESTLEKTLVAKYDLEFSEFTPDPMGHLIALGLQNINFPKRMYRLPTAQWARTQNAVLGFAHVNLLSDNYTMPAVSNTAPLELPLDAALGYVDFISSEQGPSSGFMQMYTSLENAGIRVGVAGASDFPCVTTPGAVTTYFYSEEGLTYAAWLKALKKGMTMMTTGTDFVAFSINGAKLGGVVNISSAQSVNMVIESNLRAQTSTEILMNGRVVKTVTLPSGKASTTVPVTLQKSSWVAIKSEKMVTSAISVIVNKKPIQEKKDVQYLIDYLDWLAGVVKSKQLVQEKPYPTHPDLPPIPAGVNLMDERAAILKAIREAKNIYQKKL